MTTKILWVEDDYYHIQYLFHYLEKEGAVVTPALSAYDAYRLVEKGTRYDLIVVDIILPISSTLEKLPDTVEEWKKQEKYPGIGLVKWLKTKKKVDCPVVILSVIDDPISEYHLVGFKIDEAILKKGLGPHEFTEKIQRFLQGQ